MKSIIFISATILSLVALRIWNPYPVEGVKLQVFDAMISSLPKIDEQNILLIDIDDDSLQELGQWPWPREKFCDFFGPGVTGLSILFPEADRYETDEALAECMNESLVVVSAAGSNSSYAGKPPHVGTASIGEDPKPFLFAYEGVLNNVEPIEREASGNGVTSTAPEVDGLVRRVPLIFNIADALYPSFALDILRNLAQAPSYSIKTGVDGVEAVRTSGFPVINTDSNARVWINWNRDFSRISAKDYLQSDYSGLVHLVGVTAKGASTLVATPDGLKAPHEIQAAALSTLMYGSTIARPVYAEGIELGIIFIALIVIALLASNLYSSVPALAVLIGGSLYGAKYIFDTTFLLFDPSYLIFSASVVWAITSFMQFLTQYKLKQQIKKQFEHYLDPGMVAKLQKNPELLRLGGERREMTFLFSDIRGFTPISEGFKDNPEGLVELINRFLTNQTDIILKHGGTVDKYMGDCIMAFWNAPLDDPKHAQHAMEAALEMRAELVKLNKELESENIEINTGIGINTGPCIVGNMGSNQRFDYSVIGDAVNLASRLEGQCKDFETDLIISSHTVEGEEYSFNFERLGKIQVKGKEESVTIYTIEK
jgi:adenylate cyclase